MAFGAVVERRTNLPSPAVASALSAKIDSTPASNVLTPCLKSERPIPIERKRSKAAVMDIVFDMFMLSRFYVVAVASSEGRRVR
jgi:hypothetical protein